MTSELLTHSPKKLFFKSSIDLRRTNDGIRHTRFLIRFSWGNGTGMRVYPNAFERSVFVEITSPMEANMCITVTDLLGRPIQKIEGRTNSTNEIVVDNAAPGYYIVHAATSSWVYSKRVLKK